MLFVSFKDLKQSLNYDDVLIKMVLFFCSHCIFFQIWYNMEQLPHKFEEK